jgi:hypothetical protein
MHLGSPAKENAIFLVKCADYKCLAVCDPSGKWRGYYNDEELPPDIRVIVAIPPELITPFSRGFKRKQLCPVPARTQN